MTIIYYSLKNYWTYKINMADEYNYAVSILIQIVIRFKKI